MPPKNEKNSLLRQGLAQHLGKDRLTMLATKHIGIVGAGGLGSNLAVLLVRSGIRKITIADNDCVAPSNLNRQFFFPSDTGLLKVEALKKYLLLLEPALTLTVHDMLITPDNCAKIYAGCDIVAEAVDGAVTKAALTSALLQKSFTVVSASGLAGWGGPAMQTRKIGARLTLVGDFITEVNKDTPPMGPRVMQAAALQADAILAGLLDAHPSPI